MSFFEENDIVPLLPEAPAPEENQFHSYIGSRIPWYVRLIWIGYWVFAIYYVITFLFPEFQTEIINPP